MPTHIRAQVSWHPDTALPRDAMQITPCFRSSAVFPGDDPSWQQMADDLLAAIMTWTSGTGLETTVKLYEIGLPAPNRPRAIAVGDLGQHPASARPREMALCLSFTGGNNLPQNRGRLYLPLIALGISAPSTRPTAPQMQTAADLVPHLTGLGGIDVDWITWSPTQQAATAVERWWVDDEWDVQRRRGLRETTRLTGTTSE